MNLGVFIPKCGGHIMSLVFHYMWIIPFCMGSIITVVQTGEEQVFIWNRSNDMFQEGGASLTVPLDTNLIVECPSNTNPPEYYKIYWIPVSAFDECFIDDSNRQDVQLLVNCNKPNYTTPLSFVIEIKTFSGVPGGKDFNVGSNYYIGTFSTGTVSGLGNEYQGACSDYNMKLNLSVVEAETATTPSTTSSTTASTNGSSTTTTSTKFTTTTKQTTATQNQSQTTPSTHSSTSYSTSSTSTDIPDIIINVPDGGNTGVIEANSARTIYSSWVSLVLSFCLSLLFYVNSQHISDSIQR